MNTFMTAFDFTEDDLIANQQYLITKRQKKKLKAIERILLFISVLLVVFFTWMTYFYLHAFFYNESLIMKNGNLFPESILPYLGVGSFILNSVMIVAMFRLMRNLEGIEKYEKVEIKESMIQNIEYGKTNDKSKVPYLKVHGINLRHIESYNPNLFQEGLIYRFYFASLSKCLLSVEIKKNEHGFSHN
ncbi:hypothetical protein [Leptospira sp. GIMC2001]|uniref:hypothetical protein n=1 Tax=Leptospira sp. GIMC2001 TaxID=1513297 RepID=UPI002349992B|nr:hypothetical protein [Leptospira sp. GIMC2001]WCL50341.1 hypothetical protein O4O04_05860 [Leptospira sp. GIMC2001]